MARAGQRTRRGLTLPEVLTSLIVLVLVGGTVVSIYQASIRTWRTGTVENLAQQKASWAVDRMAQDLHQGISVQPGAPPLEATYIQVRLPSRTFDSTLSAHLNDIEVGGTGKLELVQGGWVVYFRGDSDGTPSASGTCIWRRLVAADGTTVVKQDALLADNVIDNPPDESGNSKPNFIYWPDIHFTNSVEVTITVQERIGPKTAQTTISGQLGLRNHNHG